MIRSVNNFLIRRINTDISSFFRYKILINHLVLRIRVELRIEVKFHEEKKGILMPFVYIHIYIFHVKL